MTIVVEGAALAHLRISHLPLPECFFELRALFELKLGCEHVYVSPFYSWVVFEDEHVVFEDIFTPPIAKRTQNEFFRQI